MTAKKILDLIKKEEVEFVDFRFTDPRGKCHHTTYVAAQVDEDVLSDGVMFDGSSINGWKGINESDMILMPDTATAVIDPFTAAPTLILFCDVIEPATGQGYVRDPRSAAKRAEEYLKYTKIGDKAYFGPEPEFFVFDDVRFKTTQTKSFYEILSEEDPESSDADFEGGNHGHRPRTKGGYFPVQPVDSLHDLRCEMTDMLGEVGVESVLHHHEVAPSQCELGITFDTMTTTADNVQKYKYVVHNVAHAYGKTATFMPKPIYNDNGSGMHCHQSIWKGDKPLFAGNGYADLSDTAL